MSRRSRTRSARGFTVLEALVSIIILVVVMVAAVSLLFSMRGFAAKQQSSIAPRQTSRAGLDYLAYFLEGAGDLNTQQFNGNALIEWYLGDATQGPSAANSKQASYNNLAGTETGNSVLVAGKTTAFGDMGTDIVSLVIPTNPLLIPVADWNGWQHASTLDVNFTAGCAVSDAYNMYLFQQATGATPLTNPVSNAAQSGLLTLVDANGAWSYYQITGYQQSNCARAGQIPPDVIHVVCNPGRSGQIDPPSGHPDLQMPINIGAGLTFVSFRIRTDPATGTPNLEQKNGIFDPTTDNPGTAFFPIVENVEDLQVAYIYGLGPLSGQIYNTAQQQIPASVPGGAGGNVTTDGVPTQAPPPGIPVPGGYDVQNVIGVRVSVTARSLPLPLSGRKLASLQAKDPDPTLNYYYRPASEDHPQGALDYVPGPNPLVYHHQRYTTTLMIRNKALGS